MDWSLELKYERDKFLVRFFENVNHVKYGFITFTVWRFQLLFYWDKE